MCLIAELDLWYEELPIDKRIPSYDRLAGEVRLISWRLIMITNYEEIQRI